MSDQDIKLKALEARTERLRKIVDSLGAVAVLLAVGLLALVALALLLMLSMFGSSGLLGTNQSMYWILGIVFFTLAILLCFVTRALAEIARDC